MASLDMIQYHRMLPWTPKWPPLILKRLISSLLSLYTEFIQLIPPLESLPIPSSTICDITISVSDVYDALTSLNPTKAMGIDGSGKLRMAQVFL